MKHTRLLAAIAAAGAALAMAAGARADVVVLDLIVDPDGPGTWQVRAWLEGNRGGEPTSAGIRFFMIDVFGQGGVTVTGSVNRSPSTVHLHPTLGPLPAGFGLSRANGQNGIGIYGSQRSHYYEPHDPLQDAAVFQGVGIAPGAFSGLTDVEWDCPVLLASGTYSAAAYGRLFAEQGEINAKLLRNVGSGIGYGWSGPGNTESARDVLGDSEWIPEPAGVAMLAWGALGLLRRRRGGQVLARG